MKRTILVFCLLVIGIVSISLTVGGYVDDNCPQLSDTGIEGAWTPLPNEDLLVKSSNGTLYALVSTGTYGLELHASTDGYNWSSIHVFDGKINGNCIGINSTGILHMLIRQDGDKMAHFAFNLSTRTNVSTNVEAIPDAGTDWESKMMINSTDGIRALLYNYTDSKAGLYFWNGSDPWDHMAIPADADGYTSGAIASNNSIYIATHSGSNNVNVYCWDDANATILDLGGVASGGSFGAGATDLLMNETTIMAVVSGLGIPSEIGVMVSDLPAISWTIYDFPVDGFSPGFFLNGSRLELVCPADVNHRTWNFSYYVGGEWIEDSTIQIHSSSTDGTTWYMLFRATRFHEPDFTSGVLDGIIMNVVGGFNIPYYFRIFPNNASSFLNLTANTTYNEPYSMKIDPKDLNPQDIIVSVLQDTNAEDNWLDYSGGIISGTVGETDYGNTTVWARISFNDGTVNFTFNFTFNSERQRLLNITTLPHGYLRIHYRGTVSVMNNTTWYAVTNAGWASVDNTTGEITGYPLALGNFWFHIYVDDINSNNIDDQNFTVVIGISPTDTSSKITYLVTPIVIAVVGVVIVVTILFGILRSMGSTFDRFGKS